MKRMLNRLFDYFIVLLLIVLASTSIAFGLYLNRVNTKKNILDKGINILSEKIIYYINDYQYFKTNNNFTIDSNIQLKIDSEEYKNRSINDNTYKEKLNFINNLSKMDYQIKYIQNYDKKNSLFEILEKKENEEIVSYKQIVENSTDYYLIKNVFDKFINNGTNNYFETITETTTTKDNIYYLYNKLKEALIESIKEEYLDKTQTTTYVQGEQKRLNRISLHLTDEIIHNILNDIVEYLKNDEKSKILLSYIDEDFLDYRVESDKVIIEKDNDININIYYGGIFPKIEKIEYYSLKGNNKKNLYITGDTSKGEIYYIENDSTKYIMNYTISDKIKVEIKDNKDNQIGSLDYSKSDDNILLTYGFDNGIKKQDLSYTSKYYNEDKSYRNEKKITWNYKENNITKMDIEASVNYTISDTAEINQDISDAVLKSTLSETQLESLKNYKKSVEERLKNE